MLFTCRKSRRKDKDTSVITQDDNKYYLSEDFSGVKVLDRDWDELVSLPLGIDQNEWLATHSEYIIMTSYIL